MSKFDIAIMNPPYDVTLHLKILEQVIPLSNNVINVSPDWMAQRHSSYTWLEKYNFPEIQKFYRKTYKRSQYDAS